MFWSYLATAFRSNFSHPLYSMISIAGLMLGMAVAILVFLHVWQETHYDRHLPAAERIYVPELTVTDPGRPPQLLMTSPGPLAPTVAETLTGVEEATRLWKAWYTVLIEGEINFNEQIGAVDKNFPSFMGLEMLAGSRTALEDPSSVLISRSMAERLFGDDDAMGKSFILEPGLVTVGGIFEDIPQSSHMEVDILVSLNASLVRARGVTFDSDWDAAPVFSYLRLGPGADPQGVGAAVEDLVKANTNPPPGVGAEDDVDLTLEPVTAIYLNGKNYAFRPKDEAGNPQQLVIAGTVAALVLIIACINYVNIATARSTLRAREVAMRKVVGARSGQLVWQFLGESALFVAVATAGALVIAEAFSRPAGEFVGRDLSLGILAQPAALGALGAIVIAVIFLSGLYPAFVLARHRPARIFGPPGTGSGRKGLTLRSALVVFQFAASIGLMIMAGAVYSQVNFIKSTDLGFEKDNIVLLYGVRRGPQRTIEITRGLDAAISGRPGILGVTAAHSTPSWDFADSTEFRLATEAADDARSMERLAIDLDFFDTLRIQPLAGRLFSRDYGPDRIQWDLKARRDVELPVIVNETAVRALGFASTIEAVGAATVLQPNADTERNARIVGVVPDFHFKSLKTRIGPMVFYPDPARFNLMMVRIDPGRRDAAMASIEAGWNEVLPDQAISSDYLEQALIDQYVAEQRQFTVLTSIAVIAVVIGMLGLFGLSAHAVGARRREISIRKVMGAEMADVLRLLLWQFLRPVLLAMLLAWPMAWVFAQDWLGNFAYRTELSIWLFAGAGFVAILIAWMTTAVHVIKVAGTNPALVLRDE